MKTFINVTEMPSVKPITKAEAKRGMLSSIPDYVITIFNDLITENCDPEDGEATVLQDDVMERLMARPEVKELGLTRQDIFDKNWLSVEKIFRKAGWKVEYDKPGYDESYAATFIFS